MKLNRGALILCAVYTVYCFALLGLGSYIGDFKGQLYLNSLAYLPAMLPFSWLGLYQKISPHSWINSVFFFYSTSLVIVYWFGAAVSAMRRLFAQLPSPPINDEHSNWRRR